MLLSLLRGRLTALRDSVVALTLYMTDPQYRGYLHEVIELARFAYGVEIVTRDYRRIEECYRFGEHPLAAATAVLYEKANSK